MNSRKVLIAEDDAAIAMGLRMVLAEAGYQVCGIATTEWDAVILARGHRPDFVIVDVDLAEGTGIGAAIQIRREGRAQIIFSSARCEELVQLGDILEAFCIQKPFRGSVVIEALNILASRTEEDGAGPVPPPIIRIGR